ncbi:hypothetical protein H5S09_03780 [Limosilactobacillus sp. STM2_1]|uniref:Uncharacterized protein n=1 Tax=Limosilactobacillus rudii TaxID=2759755 RepID=A0A7W3UK59_9LACO|nr:hypothetical protein [Limosilactobacillus rudii]MBB1079053.1 hypothetical protein [Limosilactobacillus rudii]MBB1097072.1 hypothetical protein [Limosilactobacillus rudii]MCD7134039.1 hypothetical protein [Limosilactobacillus rudii]
MTLSDARKRANQKYLKNNPDKRRTYQYRSNAKTFIKKYASIEDLKDLQQLISEQIKEMKKE